MLSSITALMQGLVDLVKVFKRPGYMVLALALLAIGFELLAGGFWLRLFNWILGNVEFREVLETQLSENPVQGALGVFFILLSVGVACYFEHLRMQGVETPPKRANIGAKQKRVLTAFQHKSFDRQYLTEHIDTQLLQDAVQEPANTLTASHIRHVGQWVLNPKSINVTFTELSLLMDHGKSHHRERFRAITKKYPSLNSILNDPEQQQHQSFVLLGRPGGGNSTLLKHLQYELSIDALTQQDSNHSPVAFFMRLNEYPPEQDNSIAPKEWLAQRWAQAYPDLPDLALIQKQQGVVFLLDALNEMRCTDTQDYLAKVKRWKQWLANIKEQHPHCRIVFTCRSLNYSEPLSSEALTVPQIQFEDLSDEKIQEYLNHYLPNKAHELFQGLQQVAGFSEFKTPFYLNLAIEYYQHSQDFTHVTPSSLIASMVWLALERELQKTADKFDLVSLTNKDRQRITHHSWLETPHKLPNDGFLIPYLIKIAWLMQQGCSGNDSHQINIAEEQLITRLKHEHLETKHIDSVLTLASDLELLERDIIQESCQFTHQILQEYFAAHEWLKRADFSMIQQPYLIDEMKESLDTTRHKLAIADPLPPPPPHGWEQTALHAAAITLDKHQFIQTLAEHDLVLAARCATQQASQLKSELVSVLQQQLLSRMQDSHTDLRARIAAGHALGYLGDPRLIIQTSTDGEAPFINPQWVKVCSGVYPIRDNNSPDIKTRPTSIDEFYIAQHLTSNAEWRYFMEDGGYENAQWWESVSQEAELWRQGKYEDHDAINRNKVRFLEFAEDFEGTRARYNYNDYHVSIWKKYTEGSYEKFCEHLYEELGQKRRREPREWSNPRFNNPSQPIVGVGLFEILAYCQWLSNKTGQSIHLPTEAQWQAATQCRNGNQLLNYPWGNSFRALHANTVESHILCTTPIGMFTESVIPIKEGIRDAPIFDVIGNAREWTLTPFGESVELERENQMLNNGNKYTTLGGSYLYEAKICSLTQSSYDFYISNRHSYMGFRLIRLKEA